MDMNFKGITLWTAQSAVIVLALVATAVLASKMVISEQVQSPLWLPAAVGVAAAVWLGTRAIPALFIGAGFIGFALARREGLDIQAALMVGLPTGVGGTLQALAGCYLIRRFINARAELEVASDYFRLLLIAPVAGMVSPSIGVVAQTLGGIWAWDSFPLIWSNWWLGNALAIALLTPLLLDVRRRSLPQVATLASIVLVGLLASYQLSVTTAAQAQTAWEKQAHFDATQVSDIFIRALQNGYGDMRALALLFDGKHTIDESSFQAAIATLQESRDGFAPAALLVVRRDNSDKWIVGFASDNELGLAKGFDLGEIPVARDAMTTSLRTGLTLGGSSELLPGRYYGINAMPVTDALQQTVIVGIQDINEIDEIIASRVPDGLTFALSSVHASGLTTEGRDHLDSEGQDSPAEMAGFAIPRSTGGATLTFHWSVAPAYQGGPAFGLSRAILFGLPLVTLLIAVFINVLFAQAGRIRRQVERQTAESLK